MHKHPAISSHFNHAASVLTFHTPLRQHAANLVCDCQQTATVWLQQLNLACQQRDWPLLASQLSPQVWQVNLFGQAQQGIPALLQSSTATTGGKPRFAIALSVTARPATWQLSAGIAGATTLVATGATRQQLPAIVSTTSGATALGISRL